MCGVTLGPRWPTIQMFRCPSCGLIYRNPRPEKGQLNELYEESWEAPEESIGDTGGTVSNLAETYARVLADSLGLADFSGLRILDYGAGRGAMSIALKNLGADVCAVEPYGLEYLESLGIKVLGTLDEIPGATRFDGIVTIDVVEHLLEPWVDLARCHELLKPAGWIFVATPNAGGVRAALQGSCWEEATRRSHVTLFTPRSCAEVLHRSGFSRPRRLRWKIDYGRGMAVRMVHLILQSLGIDGELRYIAYAS